MKHDRFLLLGIIALAALVLPFRANAQAPTNVRVINPVETNPAPSEIISLQSFQLHRDVCEGKNDRTFFQTLPDGSDPPSETQLVPFAVPAGKLLVVTSLHWLGVTGRPNRLTYVYLDRAQGNVPKNVRGSHNTVAIATSTSDAEGNAAGYVTIPSGFVVKSGVYLCASLRGSVPRGMDSIRLHREIWGPFMQVILHGYLANDFVIRPVPRRVLVPPPTKGGATQPAPAKK